LQGIAIVSAGLQHQAIAQSQQDTVPIAAGCLGAAAEKLLSLQKVAWQPFTGLSLTIASLGKTQRRTLRIRCAQRSLFI
jgi:hypothetical protein